MNLKVCFIGLGSIGTRHLNNLKLICHDKNYSLIIDVLSSNKNRIYNGVNQIFYDYQELPSDYDLIFICNPTSMHFETIKKTIGKAKMYFVEKPIFDKGYSKNLLSFIEDKNQYYVACPLRYTNVIQYIKNNIPKDEILSLRSISSSYLPDWRPEVDYRKVYSAHKELGGGVIIDLIHELDYITYLIGFPKELNGYYSHLSNLKINSEDIAVYIGKYENTLVELHLDYFGRYPRRQIEIITNNDIIIGDIINQNIKYLKNNRIIDFQEETNDKYALEMKTFLKMYERKIENTNNILDANKVLKLAQSIEKEE